MQKVDAELEDEEVHQNLIAKALVHDAKHPVPAVYEVLQIAVDQDDLMQSRRVGHVLVLVAHGEVLICHPQHLPSCNLSFADVTLLALGFLDLLSEKVRIPWGPPHGRC